MILIDIPIGLRDKEDDKHKKREERQCDKEARAKLEFPRSSSVFPAPCRPAIRWENYDKANKINRDVTNRGLSPPTFAIIPKIREVDNFLSLNKAARLRINEIHPEICFWALSRCHAMNYKKKKRKGYDERKKVLESVCNREEWRKIEDLARKCTLPEYRKVYGVARDDVLDALAAALTAMLGYQNGFETLPQEPERDSQGLPMQMLYYLHKT